MADGYEAVFVESPVKEPEPIIARPDKPVKDKPKSGVPTLDEWQDFIGRIILRTATDAYLSLILRDIEDELTERERELIRLTKEDLKEMSAPLASMVSKTNFAKKKGRTIIAASDSAEAVIALGIWMRRVRRIARKYRKTRPQQNPSTIPGYTMENNNGNIGSNDGQGPEYPGNYGVWNPGTG